MFNILKNSSAGVANIFSSLLVSVLFVLPALVALYWIKKAQLE